MMFTVGVPWYAPPVMLNRICSPETRLKRNVTSCACFPQYQPQAPQNQPQVPQNQPRAPQYQPQSPQYQPQSPQYQPQAPPQYQPQAHLPRSESAVHAHR